MRLKKSLLGIYKQYIIIKSHPNILISQSCGPQYVKNTITPIQLSKKLISKRSQFCPPTRLSNRCTRAHSYIRNPLARSAVFPSPTKHYSARGAPICRSPRISSAIQRAYTHMIYITDQAVCPPISHYLAVFTLDLVARARPRVEVYSARYTCEYARAVWYIRLK